MGIDRPLDITADQRKIVLALLERHLPNTAAWVYGSRATWTSRPQSDLDMVVFAPPEQDRHVSDLKEAFEESTLPFRVDLFVWDAVPEQFREHIKRDHVVLVQRKKQCVQGGIHLETLDDYLTLQRGTTYQSRLLDEPGPVLLGLATIQRNGGFRTDSLRTYGGESPDKLLVQPGELYVSLKDVTQSADLLGAVARLPFDHPPGRLTQDTVKLVPKRADIPIDYLYWLLRTPEYRGYCRAHATGTTNLGLAREDFLAFPAPASTPYQRRIADTLDTLDDKIELNRRMNATLEAMARALFTSWFVDFDPVRAKMEGRNTGLPKDIVDLFPGRMVDSELGEIPEGWRLRPLDSVAHFQNGLALQKFRPAENEARLPVVKIAQLRAGEVNSGEWASSTIKPECIIENGDVVFSWSGSLLVQMWCGGRAALNQHLFKVTSEEYPKWFYLHSILSHFPEFQRIAKDKATTMGHIRRHHLSDALCVVPPDGVIARVSEMFGGWLEAASRQRGGTPRAGHPVRHVAPQAGLR